MRQGPDYTMSVRIIQGVSDGYGSKTLPVPLELEYEFEDVEYVKWTANKDGTFTLTLFDAMI